MASRSWRSRIESNVVLWLLGMLVTGFTTGWGARVAVIAASGQTIVSEDKVARLEETARALKEEVASLQAARAESAKAGPEPGRVSFESTTSGERSPILNTVESAK